MLQGARVIGNRYGNLLVIGGASRKRHFTCKCDCGNETVVLKYNLLKGNSTSCGCKRLKQKGLTTPHESESNTWRGMIRRCTNKACKSYVNYGGRGIKVCDEWLNSFECFLKDMGPRPSPRHSIDRIDNAGNYEPANCRWATKKVQANNCRKNHLIRYKDETLTLAQASDKYGIPRATLINRINLLGWDVTDAIEKPHFSRLYDYNGQLLRLPEIAKITGIKYATLYARITISNQPPEMAFKP